MVFCVRALPVDEIISCEGYSELERIEKDATVAYFKVLNVIHLKGLRKIKNKRHNLCFD
jgi:hypothetical protein